MRATDLVGTKFTPPGFYYKTFIRPRQLWPLYEKVLRHAAGLGVLRKEQPEREWRTEYRRRHADVLVVGGGTAGGRAAQAAAAQRAPTWCWSTRARRRSSRSPGVEILARASALGYFDGIVPVWQGDTLHQIRARSHVFATGTIEQPLVFAGNDLPGVMLSGGALRLTELLRGQPRHPRRGRHDLRPRPRRRGEAARRRRRDRRGRGPPRDPERGRAAAERARDRGARRPHDPRGEGQQAGEAGGARADRRRGRPRSRGRSSATSSSCRADSRRRRRCCSRPARAPTTTPTRVLRAGRAAAGTCSPRARSPASRMPTRSRARASAPGWRPPGRRRTTRRVRGPTARRSRSRHPSPARAAASASRACARTSPPRTSS